MTSLAPFPNGNVLTVAEAAERLGRCKATITSYIRSGVLPAHQIGPARHGGARYYVKVGDLDRLVTPVTPSPVSTAPSTGAPATSTVADDQLDLAAMAAGLVSNWPMLTPARKDELRRLLNTL